MKKIALLMVLALLVSGCGAGKNVGKMVLKADNIVVEREFIDYSEEENRYKIYDKWLEGEQRLATHPMFSNFAEDYWGFSNDLFKLLGKEGNVIFSPLSSYIPLSELSYAMDDCPPKEELIKLLRANSANEYWTKLLMESFQADGYLVGSSIWINDRCQPDKAFLKEKLSSDVFQVNFSDKKVVDMQTGWINKWTKGFLKEQVKPQDFTDQPSAEGGLVCRLIGTSYVKDSWDDDYFSKPKNDIFYAASGQQTVPFLHSREINTIYQKRETYETVRIPLDNGYFILVLPREETSVDKVLAGDVLNEIRDNQSWENVKAEIIMPDFTASSRMEILPILKELGYQEIIKFQEGYGKLVGKKEDGTERTCAISQILQESKIEVKKEGIQAASYTKVDVKESMALLEDEIKKVKINVNRPYLYLITDRNNLPSFIGVNREFEK